MTVLQPCFGQAWVGADDFSSGISTANWTINTFDSDQMTAVGANGHVSFLVPVSTTSEQHASIVWHGTPAVSNDWTMDLSGHNSASWSDNGGSQLQLWLLNSANHGTSYRISMEGGYNPQFSGYLFNTEADSAQSSTGPRQSALAPNTTFGLRLVHRGGAAGDVEAWYDPTGDGTNWTLLDTMSMAAFWPGAVAGNTFTVAIASDTDYGPIAEGQLWAGNFRITNSAIPNPLSGSLQVTITPPAAVSAGGKWQVDGNGAWQETGATVTNLPVGNHIVSFKPVTSWRTPANQTVAVASGAAATASAAYVPVNTTPPKVTISSPTSAQSVNEASLPVTGTVADKVAVSDVYYQLNEGKWTLAATTNSWTNWVGSVSLIKPGANTISAYAVDTTGNASLTNTVKFTYAPTAPLAVHISPLDFGTVRPNYNGTWLNIGAKYSMTATADKGFAFVNWSGSLSANTPTLTFVMASNLTLTATFVDITPPVLVILSPNVHQNVSNTAFTVTGKASDNVGVTNVSYQLNGTGWNPATTTNRWTNWTAEVTLSPGTNLVRAYAEDATGLLSKTNSVTFVCQTTASTDWAPSSLSGLSAEVTPADDATNPFTTCFGAGTFSQNMLPGTNLDNNAVGNYTYDKLTTNTALLTLASTAPPDETKTTMIGLTFTSGKDAVLSFTNSDAGIGAGAMHLTTAQSLAPTSMAGKTITSSSGGTAKLNTDGTFTLTGNGQNKSGDYTYVQYSPVSAMIVITNSGGSTDTGYLQLTFTSTTAGPMIETDFDSSGGFQWIYTGTFKLR